jgi:hypothetical protein
MLSLYQEMEKILVVYVFHLVNERVRDFIRHALFPSASIDFVIVANDPTIERETLELPSYVRFIRRPNKGLDFGAWAAALEDGSYRQYAKFVFINSSVSGPYLPVYIPVSQWPLIFTGGLSERVWLFGATINTIRGTRPHVQSFVFAITLETLEMLRSEGIFTDAAQTATEAVSKEIEMSQLVLSKGGDIDCLMRIYRNGGWRRPEYRGLGDIVFAQHYRVLWNECDLVFPKGNRGIPLLPLNLFSLQQRPDDMVPPGRSQAADN